MPLNEKHSGRDYTGGAFDRDHRGVPTKMLSELPADEFSDTTIRGGCWSCETPDTHVLPEGAVNVHFTGGANLCNVWLPPSCTADPSCQVTRFKAFAATVKSTGQKLKHASGADAPDQDWEVDGADQPTRPLNMKQFQKAGWSTKPGDYTLTATKLVAAVIE